MSIKKLLFPFVKFFLLVISFIAFFGFSLVNAEEVDDPMANKASTTRYFNTERANGSFINSSNSPFIKDGVIPNKYSFALGDQYSNVTIHGGAGPLSPTEISAWSGDTAKYNTLISYTQHTKADSASRSSIINGGYYAIYENVGEFDGESIDVKLSIVDYEISNQIYDNFPQYVNRKPYIFFYNEEINESVPISEQTKRIGVEVGYINWVAVKYEFFKHGSPDDFVSVDGYTTYWDVDYWQGIHLLDANEGLYTDSRSTLKYVNINGLPYVYDPVRAAFGGFDAAGSFTEVFSGSSMTRLYTFAAPESKYVEKNTRTIIKSAGGGIWNSAVVNGAKKSYASTTGRNNRSVKPGDTITYEIQYTNGDAANSADVVIKDTLSAGLEYVRGSSKIDGSSVADPSGASTPNLTWNTSLAPASSAKLTYDVKVTSDAPLIVYNSAKVTIGGHEYVLDKLKNPVPSKSYASDSPGKDNAPVKKGDNIKYTIKYANPFDTPTTIIIMDNISKGLKYNDDISDGELPTGYPTTSTDGSKNYRWVIRDVPAGGTGELTYSAKVEGTTAIVKNKAKIKVGSGRIMDLNELKNPVPTKSYASDTLDGANGSAVIKGDTIKYSIKYANVTDSDVDVVITDTLSKGLSYNNDPSVGTLVSDPQIDSTTGDKTYKWIIRDVPSGSTGELTYSANVDGTTSIVKNNAKITIGGSTEFVLGELKNPVPSKVYDGSSSTNPGWSNSAVKKDDVILYKIKYSNPSDVQKTVTITDVLSNGLQYTLNSAKVNGSAVTISPNPEPNPSTGMTTLVYTYTMDANSNAEFTYSAKVLGTTSEVSNNASIKYEGMSVAKQLAELKNPVPSKDYHPSSSFGKNHSAVVKGNDIKYIIKYKNSSSTAQTIYITDTLSKGLDYNNDASVGSLVGSPTTNGDGSVTYKWKIEGVAAESEGSLVYSAKVDGTTTIVKNNATIKYGDDGREITLGELKNPVPKKSYVGTVNKEVKNGDKIKYSIHYGNMTDSSQTIRIKDILSKGLRYSNTVTTGFSLTEPSTNPTTGETTLIWEKTVAAGEEGDLVYEVEVNGASTLVENNASISYNNGPEIQLDGLKNSVPTKEYNPSYVTGLNGDVVKKGDTINYVIKYANAYSSTKNITIVDTISEGLEFTGTPTATLGTLSSSGTGRVKTFTISNVGSGESGELKYTVKVTGSKVVVNNSATMKFDGSSVIDLDKLKNPVPKKEYGGTGLSDNPGWDHAPVEKGKEIVYKITYANVFASSPVNIEITDTISEGLEYVEGSSKLNGSPIDDPSVSSDGKVLKWSRNVTANTEEYITYKLKVKENTKVNVVKNNAKIKYLNTNTEIALDELNNPIPSKDYASTSEFGKDGSPVTNGDIITYSIKYSNITDESVPITIIDTLSKGLSYAGESKANGVDFNPNPTDGGNGKTILTWTKILGPGVSEELIYKVRVEGNATMVNNNATIKYGENGPVIAIGNLKNSVPSKSYGGTDINNNPGWNQAAVKIGDNIKYSIKYKNSSSTTQTIYITDTLSKGLVYNNDASVGSLVGTPTTNADGSKTYKWEIRNVQAGASGELVYSAKVDGKAEIVKNNAKVKVGDNGSEIVLGELKNPVPIKSYATDTVYGKNGAEVAEGNKIKYNIKYSNVKTTSDTVVISDTISAGLEYVEGSARINGNDVSDLITITPNRDTRTTTITLNKSLAGNTTEELTYEVLVVGDVSQVENNASITYNSNLGIALTKLINPVNPGVPIGNVGSKFSVIATLSGLALVCGGGYFIYKRYVKNEEDEVEVL